MRDRPRPSLRVALGLAVLVLGLLEVQNLIQTLRSQTRLRDRIVRGVQEAITAARPSVQAPVGESRWADALQTALGATGAAEAELFDTAGRRVASRPAAAPVEHWPSVADVAALRAGSLLTVGPVAGRDSSRLLTYASVAGPAELLLLRIATRAPDLVEDLRQRRELLVAHGVALLILLLAGGLALMPERGAARSNSGAADAYREAMSRLRAHGEAQTERHRLERHRLEEVIRDREAMARAGELTAGMVHEVRNGLGTIVGYARLVETSGAPAAATDAAARIREECAALEAVVRRFAEFVKDETLRLVPLDLGRLLARVVGREKRARAGAEVSVGSAPERTVVADEELLERAIENLVRNAREAAGPSGRVWVDWSSADGTATVRVADDGPGMPLATREQLRPFFTTKPGGLGLGLATALKIVRLHGGDLVLADRPPRGLEVLVRLPEGGPPRTEALHPVTS